MYRVHTDKGFYTCSIKDLVSTLQHLEMQGEQIYTITRLDAEPVSAGLDNHE